ALGGFRSRRGGRRIGRGGRRRGRRRRRRLRCDGLGGGVVVLADQDTEQQEDPEQCDGTDGEGRRPLGLLRPNRTAGSVEGDLAAVQPALVIDPRLAAPPAAVQAVALVGREGGPALLAGLPFLAHDGQTEGLGRAFGVLSFLCHVASYPGAGAACKVVGGASIVTSAPVGSPMKKIT